MTQIRSADETVAGEPACDETVVAPPVPAVVPELAWSAAVEDESTPRAPWRLVLWCVALIVALSGAGIAAVLVLNRPANVPAPSVPSSTTPVVVAPPPPVLTKTLGPPGPPATVTDPYGNDDAFIEALQRVKISAADRSGLIYWAHWACGEFREGFPRNDVVASMKWRNKGLTDLGASDFVDNAVAFYCPQYGR